MTNDERMVVWLIAAYALVAIVGAMAGWMR